MVAIAVSAYIGLEIEVMARRGDEETINSASTPPFPLYCAQPSRTLAPEEEFRLFNLQSPGSYNQVRDEVKEEKTQTSKSAHGQPRGAT